MQRNIAKRALAGAVGLIGLTLWSGAAAAETLIRTTTFTYDPNSGQVTQTVVEPSNATFRVESNFEYDAFGNLKKTTVSGADILTRISQAGYDTQGRFPTALTNPLNHVTEQGFSAAFGELTSVKDPNLVQSTVTLDTWGRKTLVVNGDLTRVSFQYQYCSGVNGGTASCPTNGAYRVVATPLASDGTTQIGQIVTTYFDRLDREIAKDGQGFGGQAIRITTDYDALGRVLQTSRPYFLSTGAPLWTTFTYDALERVTLEVRPDAGTIQHAYHGLSVEDTNQLSQKLTTVKNSRGEVVSVKDHLNQITSFAYDPFGNLETTTDPASNVISNSYDLYGRKVAMTDPDMGNWSYGYDVLGQLTSQTNARLQTVTLAYDKLGRLTGRVDPPNSSVPGLTSTWTYDDNLNFGIGKLDTASTNAGFLRELTYDSKGRPIQTSVTVDGSTYNTASTYNGQGKLGTVTYPSGVGVTYAYNTIGYLTSISDTATSAAYWTANTYDAELHLTKQTFGNTIITDREYNADTGRIDTIKAGPGDSVQNLGFTFNTLGNLTQRVDAVTQTTDAMSYDGLNRLTQAVTSNPSLPLNVTKNVSYDAIGNIVTKSDVGAYTYDPARVHAVASIAPGATGTVTASYAYDANGNMLTGRGRTVTWTSFDMVDKITQDPNWVSFTYDSERARLKQVSSDGSTKYYLNDSISGAMAEKIVGASLSVTWNNYIMLGGEMVALKVTGAVTQTRYFHKDHLGSVVALTDETGAVVERDSFDAWGQRRMPTGQDDFLYPGQSITSQITRGYTGHEQLDSVGLVHMNGRIYEPVIGKMMSPDPTVPNPIDGQAYNRYAYVGNNPLSLTDPSGFAPDEAMGIQNDRRNGISKGGQIGKSTPAHQSTGFTDRDDYLDALAHYRFAHYLAMTSIAQAAPTPTYNPLELFSDPDYWDYVKQGLQRPWKGIGYTMGAPLRTLGWAMGVGEEACGPCFDPGLAMSLQGTGVGMAPGSAWRVGQWSWVEAGSLLRGVGIVGMYRSATVQADTLVTVGRWMSREELSVMLETGRVVQSRLSGVTNVTLPANPTAWRAAKPGSIFVEFDVRSSAIGAADGTVARIYGPDSLPGKLRGTTEMPEAFNIQY